MSQGIINFLQGELWFIYDSLLIVCVSSSQIIDFYWLDIHLSFITVAEGAEWPGLGLSPTGHRTGNGQWRRPISSRSIEKNQTSGPSAGQHCSAFDLVVIHLFFQLISIDFSNQVYTDDGIGFWTSRLDGSESSGRLWCLLYCCLYILGNNNGAAS